MIGAQTGYPALAFTLSDDWSQATDRDDDILMVGTIPPELRDDKKISLLVDATQSWVKQPTRQPPLPSSEVLAEDAKPDSKTTVSSEGRCRRSLACSRRSTTSAASWRCWRTARAAMSC